MPNYLTKEEIRQWRSSLEKITLEEFAARLGKVIEETKATNDVVDIVMSKGSTSNNNNSLSDSFSAIAERAFKRERQISHTPFSINKKIFENNLIKEENNIEKTNYMKKEVVDLTKSLKKEVNVDKVGTVLEKAKVLSSQSNDINIVLKKSLTDREQLVFEYFLNNIGKTVYAKNLAELLELPRDYVYKYIKNLRSKLNEDVLQNADNGGYLLKV